jgi:hypothetical protein
MEIIFSLHAKYRMKRRGISEDMVIEAILHPEKLVKAHGKWYAQKHLHGGLIEVPFEKTESYINVITVYWL